MSTSNVDARWAALQGISAIPIRRFISREIFFFSTVQETALKPQAAPAATEGGHDPAQPYYSWLLNYCSWLVSNEPLASVPHDSIRVFRTFLTNRQMEPVTTRAPSHLGPWEWFGVRVQQGQHVLGVGGEMLSCPRTYRQEKTSLGLQKGCLIQKTPNTQWEGVSKEFPAKVSEHPSSQPAGWGLARLPRAVSSVTIHSSQCRELHMAPRLWDGWMCRVGGWWQGKKKLQPAAVLSSTRERRTVRGSGSAGFLFNP